MRAAPPVAVRCTGGTAWRGVQAALPALAVGVFVQWCLQWLDGGTAAAAHAVAALAAAAAAGAVAWRMARCVPQQLAWDGQRWAVDGQGGSLQLMLDLGPLLLLRHAGRRWLAVTRHDAGPAWHGLRAALHASTPQEPGVLPHA